MAKIKELDITKTGPVGYKSLQAQNNSQFDDIDKFISESQSRILSRASQSDPYRDMQQMVQSPLANSNTPWGESMFDNKTANQADFENLGDVRANNQPWYAQIGAGLAKGAILAGTTFLDGTLGLLFGAGTAFNEGRVSGLWDNDFSKAMQSINEWSEEALPNYYTDAERNEPWYENVFTANFLGDKFIKNLGFTVGAFYSGGLEAAGVRGLGKLATVGAKRLGAGIKTLKGISKASSIVAAGLGSATSAVNEGRIEALNNSKDWFELHKAQLDDEYNQRLQNIKNTYEGTEIYDQLIRAEQDAYNQALGKLNEDRLKMGNMDLLMNLPILMASNVIQFGKLYANGFKTSRKAYNILGRPGEYKAGTTRLSAAYNITKGALSEGTEEISQVAASRIAGNYYSTDVNNFYKAKTNRQASQETLDWTKSFAEGINETVNDGSSWEEFFIGSLTGALGMPRFRGMRNAQGGFQSPITIEGGAINEWREYSEKIARENEIANYMNNRINSPEFKNYYQGLIRHNKYQNDMNQAAKQGDEFNFKNAEHAQLISDVAMFDQAGKLEDLKSAINEASGTSQEDLESIVVNTTSKDENGDLIGPFSQYAFEDDNGNIIANFGAEEAVNEMASKINKNKDDILNTIKEYQDIKDELILKIGQQLSDEQLEELIFIQSQINNWQNRRDEMISLVEEPLRKELNDWYLYDRLDKNLVKLVKSKNSKEFIRNLTPSTLNTIVGEILPESDLSEVDKLNIISSLEDTIKVQEGINIFNNKLKEYLNNPQKQVEDHVKIDVQEEKESKNSQVDNMSTPDIVESIENGDLDFSGIDLNFDQSDLDILNGINTEATNEEIRNTERKTKVKNAKDIVNTKERVKEQARILTQDSNQYNELASMIDEASKSSNTPEELLDFDTEVFNNPSNLTTTPEEESIARALQEEGYNPQEIEEAILDSKNQRNDEIKGILQQIKDNINKENGELNSLPKPDDPNNIVIREFGDTSSIDSTGASEIVNDINNSIADKTSDILTPNISSLDILDNISGANISDISIRGYWKSNTTELPIHRIPSNNDPYYTSVSDPKKRALYKTIYEFLLSENVFSRLNNNEIKRGQKVRFAFSKTLTNNINKAVGEDIPILLIIDESNNIIGDLSNPYDAGVFSTFEGLSDLYKKAISYAKEHSNDALDDLIIIPNIESVVNRNYVGRPKYTSDSNGNKVLYSLNTISEGRPFKLSLALTSSPNPTMIMEPGRRKVQGVTEEEMKIIPSATAKAGQPFLLIETSDERRKYYPVPILMPLLNKLNRDTTIYKKVESLISSLLNLNVLNNPDSILKIKDKFKELVAVSDLYIEASDSNNGPNITIRIKRLNTDTSWDSVYTGPFSVSAIMESLENASISYQVSRKYINSNFEGISYNNMIGELAQTNLEIGALHTVNDFFTVNPIVEGKQEKAKPIKDSERIIEDAVKNKDRKSAINFVKKVIIPNQSKVDKTKTDKDYYYIKEDDGKYYKYERVHRILPSNFSGTSKYGDRALIIGSAIDKIVRDYFNMGKTERPEYLSDDAYKTLINYLNTLNKWIQDNNYTVFANNLVLYHKYPDGRRIAGEIDLLLVDNEGNYLIYDIKTSAYSFYSSTFDNVQSQWGQQMSTKDYYSNQLSSYATLLKDEYGKSTSKIALIPFVLNYDESNPMQVNSLVHEKNKLLSFKDVTIFFNQASSDSGTTTMDDFEKALASLEESDNTSSRQESPASSTSLTREEALQRIKDTKLFRTPQRKALLSKLEDNILSDIATMKEPILKAKLSKLDALIKPNMSKEDINSLVKNTLSATLNRNKDLNIEVNKANISKEIRKVRNILPQLSRDEAIVLTDSIIKTPTGYAWGQFKNGIITLYRNAAKGTTYHEAFHYVFNMLMEAKDIEQAYNAAKIQWGNLDAIELEERMAEDFREYMQNEETFTGRLKNIWKKFKNFINKLKGKEYYLDSLYHNISKGMYSNTNLDKREDIRYRELTKEDIQKIVDSRVNNSMINKTRVAKNNSWGKLKDSLTEQGYIIKGYYNKVKGGYIVTSSTLNPSIKQINDIRYYHINKLEYHNLSNEQKEYLAERKISLSTFNNMTLEEKEILFECMS